MMSQYISPYQHSMVVDKSVSRFTENCIFRNNCVTNSIFVWYILSFCKHGTFCFSLKEMCHLSVDNLLEFQLSEQATVCQRLWPLTSPAAMSSHVNL